MAARAVRLITDVAAVDRPFDYLVTDATERVAVGDRVRVDFHNRRVSGWVLEEVAPSEGLKPLTKWQSIGPPPTMTPLLAWAAKRWCAPLAKFYVAATTKKNITTLPSAPTKQRADAPGELFAPGVWQVSPTTDPLDLILGAYESTLDREGSLLVLVPNEGWAQRLAERLRRRGVAVAQGEREWDKMRAGWPVIVGVRGGAFAPTPTLCGAVIVDADDDAYRSESAPTWHALDVVLERCRRDQAPWWATSVAPSPMVSALGDLHVEPSVAQGWPALHVVDRRNGDPLDGVLTREALDLAHEALRGSEAVAVVVVLQRLGTGRLFACKRCGELARCATCQAPEEEVGGQLSCAERHEMRENFCRHCGSTNLKRVRSGVTTLARDVANLLSQPVSEVSAATPLEAPLGRVVVGTEAVWQRVRRCGVVIFVDFDQYLLAPRASAKHQALVAVAKAGRLVGPPALGRGRVVIQTRRGHDAVVAGLEAGDLSAIIAEEQETAEVLGLAPYRARALLSGEGAAAFAASLPAMVRTRVQGDQVLVDAPNHQVLSEALAEGVRPASRVRIAVE